MKILAAGEERFLVDALCLIFGAEPQTVLVDVD